MKNLFNSIQLKKPQGNTFDLTHDVKLSGRMGNLIPIMAMECVPGDSIRLGADCLVRFAPLIAPVMHRMNAHIHYFFVPNRLVWENWEDFITNTGSVAAPYFTIDGTESAAEKQFLDYMGVPPASGGATPEEINAIPLAAYQMIYNEYYRDQNLVADVNFQLTDGANTGNSDLITMRRRAYMHDYFTSALPFAQKGAAVDLPLGEVSLKTAWTGTPNFKDATGTPIAGAVNQAGTVPPEIQIGLIPAKNAYDPDGTLEVGATTINDLRRAFRLQEWLEKMARGGSRYIEQILAHFGVRSSDKRLDRPEYITGVKSPIVVSEVLNTTGETAGLPQGNMAGHAVSVGQGNVGSYFCEEHGFIIGIMSITPLPAYQQGLHKSFLKREALDYYWPSFANIGEQEVLNKEIFAYVPTGGDTFGYIPRYSEYRYMPNRVAGDFRTTLSYWHLGRIFSGLPALTQEFIEVDPDDQDRIFAVTAGDDNLYCHILNKVIARRLMPVYGTPML